MLLNQDKLERLLRGCHKRVIGCVQRLSYDYNPPQVSLEDLHSASRSLGLVASLWVATTRKGRLLIHLRGKKYLAELNFTLGLLRVPSAAPNTSSPYRVSSLNSNTKAALRSDTKRKKKNQHCKCRVHSAEDCLKSLAYLCHSSCKLLRKAMNDVKIVHVA